MFTKYPTKEQIIENPIKIKKLTIAIIIIWKKELWSKVKNKKNIEKFYALQELIRKLEEVYQKPIKEIKYNPETESCSYKPLEKTIVINKSVSIISTLHEFAHHLYGPSELKTCRWSVEVFKQTFPKAIKNLEWKGHMLMKK